MKIAELLQSPSDGQVQYVPFNRLEANPAAGELFGRQAWIARIDNLLTMKRIANRPKDHLDIAAPEKIRRGDDPNV